MEPVSPTMKVKARMLFALANFFDFLVLGFLSRDFRFTGSCHSIFSCATTIGIPPPCPLDRYNFSATLNLALLERGFCSTSSSEGRIGFRVNTLAKATALHRHTGNSGGQVHRPSQDLILFLTIRSSLSLIHI